MLIILLFETPTRRALDILVRFISYLFFVSTMKVCEMLECLVDSTLVIYDLTGHRTLHSGTFPWNLGNLKSTFAVVADET